MTIDQPTPEPFRSGLLEVGEGHAIYWEMSGNPAGNPALWLHGGPGSSLRSGSYRRHFDLDRTLVIGIDQRGCGRSRPLAVDALDTLPQLTTSALIDDIEAVRRHLGVERWLVAGMSWGTTLALAYALAHPSRVSELVLAAVTTTSRDEVDWITQGFGRLVPEAWHRFEGASARRQGERVVEAYARRLAAGPLEDRIAAARAWIDWERAIMALDPNASPSSAAFDARADLAFATLVTHFWAHDGFLRDGQEILGRVAMIGHIPAVLIHGRRDISSPAVTAWRLNRHWPASRLLIVETEGHGGPEMTSEMRGALDRFASAPQS